MTDTDALVSELRSAAIILARKPCEVYGLQQSCEKAADAIDRLTRERDEAKRAAASYKAWDFPADLQALTVKLETAEAALSAARAELAKWCERHAAAMPEDAEECTKIAGLLRTPVAVDDAWQPIETAPQDWSSIMLYVPDDDLNDKVVEGYWSHDDGGDGCWKTAGNDVVEPTMWQPKPSEPAALQAGRK